MHISTINPKVLRTNVWNWHSRFLVAHCGFRLRGNPESSACDHNFTCINSASLYNIPEDFSVLLSGRHSAGSVEASCLHVCLANMPQT